MKTNLLFTLSFLLSLITSAQRIDYALNHQPGIQVIKPLGMQVDGSQTIWVSYVALDERQALNYYISALTNHGQLISTHQLVEVGNTDGMNFSVMPTGANVWFNYQFSFGTLPSYQSAYVLGVTYSGIFWGGNVAYEYHADSLLSFDFKQRGSNFSISERIKDDVNRVRMGNLNTLQTYEAVLDSPNAYWWGKMLWLKENTLYMHDETTLNGVMYHFNDSMQLLNKQVVMHCTRPVLFRNKLYDLKNNFRPGDTITSLVLKNEQEATLRLFDCREAIYPFGALVSTQNYLVAVHQREVNIGSTKYDSLVINYIDSTLKFVKRIPIAWGYQAFSVEADSLSSDVFILGKSDNELVLMAVNLDGIISCIKQIDLPQTLFIYPNPATTELHLSLPHGSKFARIYNLQGKLLQTQEASNTYSVTDLNAGMYFIEITDEHERVIGRSRFIKQ
jgi:hypothetical protein